MTNEQKNRLADAFAELAATNIALRTATDDFDNVMSKLNLSYGNYIEASKMHVRSINEMIEALDPLITDATRP